MFPILLQLGPVYISSLGFFSFLGFLMGAFVFWRRGKEEGFDEDLILDLWIVSILAVFLFGRLIFCLTNPAAYNRQFLGYFDLTKLPGFSIFGAFLGMISSWLIFAKKQKWNFWKVADTAIFSFIIVQVLVRLGQFLDGSFFGKITSLPWGLHFPAVDGSRHPIQIYEILVLILLYWLLLKLECRYRLFHWYQDRRGEARPGFLVLTYFLLYSLWRLGLEFARTSSLYFKGIAWEQALSFIIILGTIGGFWIRSGRKLKINFSFLKKDKLKPLIAIEKKIVRRPRRIKKFKHIRRGLDAK